MGLTELIKLKMWVLSEVKERYWEKWVHSEKVGAFRANRTEKVGAFRANKTKIKGGGGLYRDTDPYCFNMGVPPPGL